ncbi:MAG: nitrogenase-stabilizing/protective protein NifW [Azoarcus sp.]|jgi:nitrogenase-stabilizing/protective protein|nr:nitrogenase-stabilizing/protective protein NifW [Azoarcus sp.]
MDELTLDEAMEELSAAEDFLEYFGVIYEPQVVHVNRLHILQRFHDYLSNNPLEGDDQARYTHHRSFLEMAYRDFTVSDAVTEKVFSVFKKASGTAFVPLGAVQR